MGRYSKRNKIFGVVFHSFISTRGANGYNATMRLPIGIQDFTKLRENNYIYVDKTMFLTPFLQGGSFFLSRPRRFGKSLLLSTLKAAFSGRKDLFKGLWLEHNHDFKEHPILRLDFSNINFTTKSLDEGITDWLRIAALEYNYEIRCTNARDAFRELIFALSKVAKVVVLIDEYDKPLTDYLLEPEKRQVHQQTLKSVYGVLKPLDEHLHLVFLTGVSKFGKLSLFSDLNNLQDMSLDANYAMMFGYTKSEIELFFTDFIPPMLKNLSITYEAFWDATKRWYNGYSWDGKNRVYCPFSFLLFLEQKEFKSFWYETGTPTFLLELIKNQQIDPLEFETKLVDESPLVTSDIENLDPIGLMFQTGYLTIGQKKISIDGTEYKLTYPNHEVRLAFSRGLLATFSKSVSSSISGFAMELRHALLQLNWNMFFARVNSVLATVPYEIFPRKEIYANSLLHLILLSTGFDTQSQVQTSLGRMDTILETNTHFIIFELKTSGQPEKAVQQISSNQYAQGLSGKLVLGIGVIFDLETKSIVNWEVIEL
jgi:hypothetical protein